MSDDLSQAAESAEAAQSAVEPTDSPVPWGDDFDAQRAWRTITHQRDQIKEFESDAKFAKRLREDEDALKEFLAEKGYSFDDEDEEDVDLDPSFDEDPTADLRSKLSELEKWKTEQEAERGWNQFNKDVDALAKEAKVELSPVDRDAIFRATVANGNDKKAADKAFNAHVEYLKAQEKAIVDRYLKSKTDGVPSPPQAGKAGRAEFDPTDRKARKARFEQIVAGQQQ